MIHMFTIILVVLAVDDRRNPILTEMVRISHENEADDESGVEQIRLAGKSSLLERRSRGAPNTAEVTSGGGDAEPRSRDAQWHDAVAPLQSEVSAAVPQDSLRHIQYLPRNQAGISDRISVFNTLLHLRYLYNATVHIDGGAYGAKIFLSTQHSQHIRSDWAHYIDVKANDGNPFHDLLPSSAGCKSLAKGSALEEIGRKFDEGAKCVNIPDNMYSYSDRGRIREKAQSLCKPHCPFGIRSSDDVVAVADSILCKVHDRKALRKSDMTFQNEASRSCRKTDSLGNLTGAIHIRRCDRIESNTHCTDPEEIKKAVSRFPKIITWLVFWYAEHEYRTKLEAVLNAAFPNKLFTFEENIDFSGGGKNDGSDNYFITLVQQEISRRVEASVNTHDCRKEGLQITHKTITTRSRKIWDPQYDDVWLRYEAFCH